MDMASSKVADKYIKFPLNLDFLEVARQRANRALAAMRIAAIIIITMGEAGRIKRPTKANIRYTIRETINGVLIDTANSVEKSIGLVTTDGLFHGSRLNITMNIMCEKRAPAATVARSVS
ncbi:hypothetical protein GCM10027066_15630 [Dyella jejuensis]